MCGHTSLTLQWTPAFSSAEYVRPHNKIYSAHLHDQKASHMGPFYCLLYHSTRVHASSNRIARPFIPVGCLRFLVANQL